MTNLKFHTYAYLNVLSKIFLVSYLLLSTITFSQDTNIVKYFPLKVGNVWVYSGYHSITSQCSRTSLQRISVDSQITNNSKIYFKVSYSKIYLSGYGNCGFTYLFPGYYRVDSINGNVYKLRTVPDTLCPFNPFEILIDSLKGKQGDTAFSCSAYNYFKKVLRDTANRVVFGISKPTRYFEGGNFFEYSYFGQYSKDIGLTYFSEYGISISSQSFIRGCSVNGEIYGDTSYYLVGLNPISGVIPLNYGLSQNYPNPFNPVTQISFDIPNSSFVKLNVYDALGKEIEQLLNEELPPGTYKYDWNASSYPSGIYFYKIQAGEFIQSKKMILIK